MREPSGESRLDRRTRIVAASIVAAGGVLAALIAAGVFSSGKSTPPRGEIEFPTPGARVGREFTVDGRLSHIPEESHIWLAAQVGNLLYPKEPEVPSGDIHFSQQMFEGGNPPGGSFTIVLLMVGPDGQRSIETWLAALRRDEEPPALTAIPGRVELDAVPSVHLMG